MEQIGSLGVVVFALSCAALGLRLLVRASRTRALPELYVGAALLLTGGLGAPLSILARQLSLEDETRGALAMVLCLCSLLGAAAVFVSSWRVFRPASAGAMSLCTLLAVALATLFVAQGISPGFLALAKSEPGPWRAAAWLTTFGYLWTGFESARHCQVLRRREKIGLVEPVVIARFRLWMLASVTAAALSATAVAVRTVGADFHTVAWSGSMLGTFGMVVPVSLWLAFLPPRPFLERIAEVAAPDTA